VPEQEEHEREVDRRAGGDDLIIAGAVALRIAPGQPPDPARPAPGEEGGPEQPEPDLVPEVVAQPGVGEHPEVAADAVKEAVVAGPVDGHPRARDDRPRQRPGAEERGEGGREQRRRDERGGEAPGPGRTAGLQTRGDGRERHEKPLDVAQRRLDETARGQPRERGPAPPARLLGQGMDQQGLLQDLGERQVGDQQEVGDGQDDEC
jgi:hypothetical protein